MKGRGEFTYMGPLFRKQAIRKEQGSRKHEGGQ